MNVRGERDKSVILLYVGPWNCVLQSS